MVDADGLAKTAAEVAKTGQLPPVEKWNPAFCGDIDIRIARDGTWFYLGTPIGRDRLVRLFSTILKREGDDYFLVTPVEKVGIKVEDVPFVAVDFRLSGSGEAQSLIFTTNVGDEAEAGPDHPIRVARDSQSGEAVPYILIRRNLEARIDRKSFYRLVELGEELEQNGARWFGIRSGGTFFPMIPATELV